ncbi:MAG: AEC family transporter [Gammaproteobacteria bacterium]|nr:MAG: AEC family transporter [Gammaproteobacteria bacterium]
MITGLLGIIAPVFLLAGAGFLWQRRGLPFDQAFITRLVIDLCAPALVIVLLAGSDLSLDAFAGFALQVLAALAVMGVVAAVLARRHADPRMHWVALVFPNTANMGMPLCLLAFGEPGLVYATVYYTVTSLVHFTLGVSLVAEAANAWRASLKTPLIWATLLGLLLMAMDVTLPTWVANSLKLLGQPTIPLMLFTLGVSLARLPWAELFRRVDVGLERLLVGAIAAAVIVWVFQPEGVVRGVLVLETLMPSAIFNYLLAARFGRHLPGVTAIVAWSTVMVFLLLPWLLYWLLPVAGQGANP